MAGKVTSSGGGGFNNVGQDPRMFTLIACGTNTQIIMISAGGAYYSVYAPNNRIVVGGGGDVWGSIVGRQVDNTGGSDVHVDLALVGASSDGTINGGWSQPSF